MLSTARRYLSLMVTDAVKGVNCRNRGIRTRTERGLRPFEQVQDVQHILCALGHPLTNRALQFTYAESDMGGCVIVGDAGGRR